MLSAIGAAASRLCACTQYRCVRAACIHACMCVCSHVSIGVFVCMSRLAGVLYPHSRLRRLRHARIMMPSPSVSVSAWVRGRADLSAGRQVPYGNSTAGDGLHWLKGSSRMRWFERCRGSRWFARRTSCKSESNNARVRTLKRGGHRTDRGGRTRPANSGTSVGTGSRACAAQLGANTLCTPH